MLAIPDKAEIVVKIGDGPHDRDGDVLQVFTAYDALLTNLQKIIHGRSRVQLASWRRMELRDEYVRVTRGMQRDHPSPADLARMWTMIENWTGGDAVDFARYPVSGTTDRVHLRLPLSSAPTDAQVREWFEADRDGRRTRRVNWQSRVVDAGHARSADVLDAKTPVRVRAELDPATVAETRGVR